MQQHTSGSVLRCGIIDVGSNTIRAAVYELQGGAYHPLADQRDFSNILTYVKAGVLTEEGIERLYRVLKSMAAFCRDWGCRRVDCFATASLRGISNFEEVRRRTAAAGVQLNLLSGEEEALCDYHGLLQWAGVGNSAGIENGAGMDLGGGSCQLFRFQNRRLLAHGSFPIGVMAMKRLFSMDCAPGAEHRDKVEDYVQMQLDSCGGLRGAPVRTLYVMGGTVRAAYQMYLLLDGKVRGEEAMALEDMEALYSCLSKPEGREAVLAADPDRLPTMGSGLIIMMAICEYMGADRVVVARNGVREGYLWKNVMKTMR